MDYGNYRIEHINELNSLPEPYYIEAAIENNEIVVNWFDPNNTERFFEFITNTNNGIPDKIRIIRYGIDNPELATKSILEYNGKYFIFSEVGSSGQPKTYYGNEITLYYHEPYEVWIYNLKTYDGESILVFSLFNISLK